MSITLQQGATSAEFDNTYTVAHGADGGPFSATYANPLESTGVQARNSDGFNTVRGYQEPGGGILELFDLATVLSDSLDYVQLARFSTPYAEVYLAFGRELTAAQMPTAGSAVYNGSTRGSYASTSGIAQTGSAITLNVNFGSGSVSGATSNLRYNHPVSGVLTSGAEIQFAGAINGGTSRFNGTATSPLIPGVTGAMEGSFFGPTGGGPEEMGLVYSIHNPGAPEALTGGASLGRAP